MRNGNFSMLDECTEYEKVLILPMRNGNIIQSSQSFASLHHRSYPTYEEWKPRSTLGARSVLKEVLILPMRNGNITKYTVFVKLKTCSYPTYEEWKLHFLYLFIFFHFRSYPTYEEWKQFPS